MMTSHVRALGVLLLALLGLSCSSVNPVYITVDLSGVPANATAILPVAVVDATFKPGKPVSLPLLQMADPGRHLTFSLSLPAGSTGTLSLGVAAVDANGCLLAVGSVTGPLADMGSAVQVPLSGLASAACPAPQAQLLLQQGQIAPYLTSVTPSTIIIGKTTQLTIFGFGFLPGIVVLLNGMPTQVTWRSAIELAVILPSQLGPISGQVPISLQNPDQVAVTMPPKMLSAATPSIVLNASTDVIANPFASGFRIGAITLADMDGDKKLDMLLDVGNPKQPNGIARVLRNKGGSFDHSSQNCSPLADDWCIGNILYDLGTADRIPAADINGDGIQDFVTTQGGVVQGISVNLGQGKSGLNFNTASIDLASSVFFPTLSDVNRDGAQDLVYASDAEVGSGKGYVVKVVYNTGTAKDPLVKANLKTYYLPDQPGSITGFAVADMNNDGWNDVVVAAHYGPNIDKVCILINQKIPGQSFPDASASNICTDVSIFGTASLGLIVADLNRDGLMDIVINYEDGGGEISTMINNKDNPNTFTKFTTVLKYSGQQLYAVAAGDMDGDLMPEIVAADTLGYVTVLKNDGQGNFSSDKKVTLKVTDNVKLNSVALGDIDGDGHLDIVTGSNNVYIVFNSTFR